MDTSSYLSRLESLLSGLPAAERQYAIAYYSEYLMDAGSEGFEAAVAALGTPESLAAQIKADAAMRGLEDSLGLGSQSNAESDTVDKGGSPGAARAARPTTVDRNDVPADAPAGAPNDVPAASQAEPAFIPNNSELSDPGTYSAPSAASAPPRATPPEPQKNSTLTVIMLVLLAIFALPIGVPLAAAVFGLVVSLLAGIGGIALAIIAVGLVLIVTSLASICVGFVTLFVNWPVGLFYIGLGCAMLSVALLFNLGMFYLLRWTFKGIALLFNAIRKRLSKQPDATRQEVNHA